MKLLAFSGSLRRASFNKRLVVLASDIARAHGATVDVADFADFDAPSYNGDIQDAGTFPDATLRLRDRLADADGLLISSPEYNYSLPGGLKNALDWLSRVRPLPTADKRALLLSASPGLVGGVRGLWQLRIPLEGMGVHVYPGMFSLSNAHTSFNEQGDLQDAAVRKSLESTIEGFLSHGPIRRA
jgi:chromate reductase, NAD(P)H dehydrogenase (quinone)